MLSGKYKTVGDLIDALSRYDRKLAVQVEDVGGEPCAELYGICATATINGAATAARCDDGTLKIYAESAAHRNAIDTVILRIDIDGD